MKTRILAALLLTLPAAAVPAAAAETAEPAAVDVREWPVPWEESRPRDPYVAPDGSVWFVGQRSDYVARLDPASGDFRKFDLEAGAGPHNLIVSDQGEVWYAGNRAAHVGRGLDLVRGNRPGGAGSRTRLA